MCKHSRSGKHRVWQPRGHPPTQRETPRPEPTRVLADLLGAFASAEGALHCSPKDQRIPFYRHLLHFRPPRDYAACLGHTAAVYCTPAASENTGTSFSIITRFNAVLQCQ